MSVSRGGAIGFLPIGFDDATQFARRVEPPDFRVEIGDRRAVEEKLVAVRER